MQQPIAANGTYQLGNHPGNIVQPPGYGLRLDGLLDGGLSEPPERPRVVTFDFEHPESDMKMEVNGSQIRIYGTAFGGRDVGDIYDPNNSGLWEIDFTYNNVALYDLDGQQDNDLFVAKEYEGTNTGMVRQLYGDGLTFDLSDKADDQLSFQLGDRVDDSGHRGFDGISGWGWLMHSASDEYVAGSDWIFTATPIDVEASLGDKVFADTNSNGIQDDGELGVEGVSVTLTGGGADGLLSTEGDNTTETTTTDADGMYIFTGLNAGEEYKVTFTAPDGFEFTTPNEGSDDTVDSDVDPITGMSQMVTLADNEYNPTIDAGLIEVPDDPGIDIEKFTDGADADTADLAVEIAAGDTVTWTYEVTNTGNVAFAENEITVTDDREGEITKIVNQGDDGDAVLSPGETWIYEKTGVAQDLSSSTGSEDLRFHLTGNSYTTGPAGNVRTFETGGVSVDVSAFSSNKSGGDWKTAYLGAYGGGLGVTNQNESGHRHRVDNRGSNDYILFEFDRQVTVDRAFLDYVSGDSDISVWIGDRNGDISTLDSSILSGFTKEHNNGGGYDRWADFNDQGLVGDTLVISARDDHNYDNFKLRKLDVSVAGDTTVGTYANTGTVTAGSVSDEDLSHYTNPEAPEPEDPGIAIEKLTNGADADTPDLAVEIAPGDTVTWTYEVTNTGNVAFAQNEITVTDDIEGGITDIIYQGEDGDALLAPGETWIYEHTGVAEDLSTSTGSEDIRFHLTGNSYTNGPVGNVRTFSEGGVSVDVSAFSSNKHGEDWKEAYLGAYGGGLGVTNQNESGHYHRVDNGGSNDYILFEFNQQVTVDRAFLDYVSGDSDISVWIGDRNGDISTLDSSILSGFTKEHNNGHGYDRWADFNDQGLTGDTLVISARDDHNYDAFKLRKLDVSVGGSISVGNYVNVGTVQAGSVSAQDSSSYTNPLIAGFMSDPSLLAI